MKKTTIDNGNRLIGKFMGKDVRVNYGDVLSIVETSEFNKSYYNDTGEEWIEILYDSSWDWLMPVVTKIHNDFFKQGIEYRDEMYTLQILLGSGYLFEDTIFYQPLPFKIENVWSRVVLFLQSPMYKRLKERKTEQQTN